jgi:hypothetical protein
LLIFIFPSYQRTEKKSCRLKFGFGPSLFFFYQSGDPKDRLNVILRRHLVFPFKAAPGATVYDGPCSMLDLGADRFHGPTASRGTVAGMDVYVLAPETYRTMVGVPVSAHGKATFFANKILFGTFEPARHIAILTHSRPAAAGRKKAADIPKNIEMSYHTIMPLAREKYMAELKRRGKESHVYRSYQLVGLEIADMLNDRPHKALYIKMAKEKDQHRLLAIARDIVDRKEVKNKGAYFMRIVAERSAAEKK